VVIRQMEVSIDIEEYFKKQNMVENPVGRIFPWKK
jgi:hypothetical protein